MAKKTVKMILSEDAYKNFKASMNIMGFTNEDWFMKYCALNTIKTVAPKSAIKQILKEMKELKAASKTSLKK